MTEMKKREENRGERQIYCKTDTARQIEQMERERERERQTDTVRERRERGDRHNFRNTCKHKEQTCRQRREKSRQRDRQSE